ncbi:bis(5'-nucleosyl)-tetraphosphatase (symmetrical) YqeK [Streptococcus parasuis]|uniref:bis(5'-nucleosyl)-tetraphosphatase (symmetrical) YqeK n=1 Tax=Streptococcus parasuis TaxID=1501662 RepID=UPI001C2BE7D2|nr:bis(5'-nucleosyl)-tetraphosphatase (symmetrical) YqeK [Streptococcus parasuis]MDG3146959.1 bis(5'-nucleosyl)-tetraphosphatase (symmetrical) YqeK [Streptococcus suis]MBV1944673.1 bis(5'-nucleosyl)-tetraphosphatase (symmetrical) YqeK [Streptococcus parasuis]MDG3181775.1 bis(5'-nucleosyl)-tetraphosphatase (symmetrical) YqeK [Streptococcus suis]MDG3214292.1 bis(5'-nucleosyl)-tetraphosphatase (symmetrical) YqeK [Streptococcus suis]QXF05722.1 bis(5'-nucleosyl)-tetraphosphatase (symmetrical) YqeK 
MINSDLDFNREALLEKISAAMKPKRFQHILGVEEAALELADQYGCDPKKASLAALLHDYAKEVEDKVFLDLIAKYELDKDLLNWDNNIWHGVVGVYKIAEDFGLEDEEILQAIQRHTVGAREMSLLDKVLYVADYIEPNRDFPGVDEARRIAKESLDKAVAFEAAQTISYLAKKGIPIYPQTLETYNAYVGELGRQDAVSTFRH